MKVKYRVISYLILSITIVLFTLIKYLFPELQINTVENILTGFGPFGIVIYLILVILSVPLPIPSSAFILAGGYAYGLTGVITALIGVTLGSIVAFAIIRTYGKPLLYKLVDKHHIEHFQKLFDKRGTLAVLISYSIPLFPSDILSLFLGLTNLTYKRFIYLVILGHIPRVLIIGMLGEGLYNGLSLQTFVIFALVLLFVLIASCRTRLRQKLFKEL